MKKRLSLGFKLGVQCCFPYGAIGIDKCYKKKVRKQNQGLKK